MSVEIGRWKRRRGLRATDIAGKLATFARTNAFQISLCLFLLVLVFLGGSSRYDRIVQIPVRLAAILVLVWSTFRSARAAPRALMVPAAILGMTVLLICIQLIPLPPDFWSNLPERAAFVEVAKIAGFAQPWRPLAISPDLAVNSLLSLTVPAAVLYGLSVLSPQQSRLVYTLILGIIAFSLATGVVQLITGSAGFAGIYQSSQFTDASGIFANRNHQALLLAMGIPLTLGWKSIRRGGAHGVLARWGAGFGIAALIIVLLPTGSRAGLALGATGLLSGLALLWGRFRDYADPGKRSLWMIGIGLIAATLTLGALVIFFGRGEAFDRLIEIDPMNDRRLRALSVVLHVAWSHLPVGSGFGSFDIAFRHVEPLDMLDTTYFNQAHNDLVQIVLEGGIPGLLLLIAAVGWLAVATFRLWRNSSSQSMIVQGRAASTALILMVAASAVDYPLRTPVMMALASALTFQVALSLDELGRRSKQLRRADL